eukprot:4649296-Amphidinium_carterae.1
MVSLASSSVVADRAACQAISGLSNRAYLGQGLGAEDLTPPLGGSPLDKKSEPNSAPKGIEHKELFPKPEIPK